MKDARVCDLSLPSPSLGMPAVTCLSRATAMSRHVLLLLHSSMWLESPVSDSCHKETKREREAVLSIVFPGLCFFPHILPGALPFYRELPHLHLCGLPPTSLVLGEKLPSLQQPSTCVLGPDCSPGVRVCTLSQQATSRKTFTPFRTLIIHLGTGCHGGPSACIRLYPRMNLLETHQPSRLCSSSLHWDLGLSLFFYNPCTVCQAIFIWLWHNVSHQECSPACWMCLLWAY